MRAEKEHPSPTLSTLLGSLASDAFLQRYWEKEPLHGRGATDRYSSLLCTRRLEELLVRGDLRHPAIQLAKDGAYLAPSRYTRDVKHGSEVFSAVADVERVQEEYRAGASIVLPAVHRIHPPLGELAAQLERELDHAVHANAYLTPGGAKGFSPHYDTHEVFVLQVAGTKRWRVYPPPLRLPHRTQPFSPAGYALPPEPLLEIDLQPGDLLYLPRGFVHTAETLGGYAAHVTVGVTVYTWLDLASELLASGAAMEELRRALPVGFARREGGDAALAEGLRERMRGWLARGDEAAVVEAFRRRARSRVLAPAAFRADVCVLGLDTPLRLAAGRAYRATVQAGSVVLEQGGKRLVVPDALRVALDAMCARGSFCLRELPRQVDDEVLVAFARRLESAGFLEGVPSASPSANASDAPVPVFTLPPVGTRPTS